MPQSPITPTINNMADVWEAYHDELEGMERQARTNLDSSVALVNTVAAHILNSGGKRIRPFLLLLSARLCGYTGRDHHQLASLVEFIHTASLLHDDVVDDADIRRGRRTARKVWGNQISILVGDYLYSKAFTQVVDFRNHGINEVLGEACKKMAEGEVLQLYYNGNPTMSEAEYLKIVDHKTAGLIAAACRMGAILADASEAQQDALFRFGHHLGIAFQVADDTLDYTANGEHLGKTRAGPPPRQGHAATVTSAASLFGTGPADDRRPHGKQDPDRGRPRSVHSLDGRIRLDYLCHGPRTILRRLGPTISISSKTVRPNEPSR